MQMSRLKLVGRSYRLQRTVKEGLTYDQRYHYRASVSFTNLENLYMQDSVGGSSEKLSMDLLAALTGTSITQLQEHHL